MVSLNYEVSNSFSHLMLFTHDGTIALRRYLDEEFLSQEKELIVK